MDGMLIWVFAALLCSGFEAEGHSHLPEPTPLKYTITRAGCGSSKLCAEDPVMCNPSVDSPCFFTSSRSSSSSSVEYELSSSTSDYIGLGESTNPDEEPSVFYVCGNNNGSFVFQIINKNNSITAGISSSVSVVNSVQGSVGRNQTRVQCSFSTSRISRRTSDPVIIIIIIIRERSGIQLDSPVPVFNTTIKASQLDSASAAPSTSSRSSSLTHSAAKVLAVLLSVLSLYLRF